MRYPERARIRSLRNPSWASASQEKILLLYSAFLSPSGRFAGHAKFVPESPEGPVRDLITALESSPRLCLTDWSCKGFPAGAAPAKERREGRQGRAQLCFQQPPHMRRNLLRHQGVERKKSDNINLKNIKF